MKDDFSAPHRRPSHRLGIAPALMTDGHAKLEAVDLEELPGIYGHIDLIFARVDLVLGLVSLNMALGIDAKGGNLPARRRELFHTEDCHDPLGFRLLGH